MKKKITVLLIISMVLCACGKEKEVEYSKEDVIPPTSESKDDYEKTAQSLEALTEESQDSTEPIIKGAEERESLKNTYADIDLLSIETDISFEDYPWFTVPENASEYYYGIYQEVICAINEYYNGKVVGSYTCDVDTDIVSRETNMVFSIRVQGTENTLIVGLNGYEHTASVEPIEWDLAMTDTLLEIYREFLRGNMTADYQGTQVTYGILLNDIYGIDNDYEPEQSFALTDFDKNNIPELQIQYNTLGHQTYFSLDFVNDNLEVVNEVEYSQIMGFGVMYEDGSMMDYQGGSNTAYWYRDKEDNPLAVFSCLDSTWYGEETSMKVQEDSARWYDEGYKYVYVTSDNLVSWEEFEAHRLDFEEKHCAEKVLFSVVEENTISEMIW